MNTIYVGDADHRSLKSYFLNKKKSIHKSDSNYSTDHAKLLNLTEIMNVLNSYMGLQNIPIYRVTHLSRDTSEHSGTAQNEHNKKP